MNTDRSNTKAGHACRDLHKLKQLNAQVAALQNLTRDYSLEMMPQWISFSTTNFCNLRCPHCQTHGTEEVHKISNAQRWPDDLVTRLTEETLPYAFEFCLSLNGEPLATPYLKQRLREFHEYGAKLHLTTNGTLLSKKTLIKVLPLASTIHISIDGATERTCEAIRLGSNFKKLIYNIKLLTRAYELLSRNRSTIDIRLACTVMTSNVRDMPEMVRLAHFLTVPAVDFYSLVILFPHVRGEDLKLQKPLYNAYCERAQKEANRLGIAVRMPEPFLGVLPDTDVKIHGEDLIVGQLPESYYDNLPPLEDLLDLDALESDASEIVSQIMEEQTPDKNAVLEGNNLGATQDRLEGSLEVLLERHKSELRNRPGEEKIPYCEDLFKRSFVTSAGDVAPCCMPGRPVLGNVNTNTMKEIYNGKLYNDFRKQFFSSKPPDVCQGCQHFLSISKQELLDGINVPKI